MDGEMGVPQNFVICLAVFSFPEVCSCFAF